MDRIEFEYPLFKVYYSNNSNICGNPAPNLDILYLPSFQVPELQDAIK